MLQTFGHTQTVTQNFVYVLMILECSISTTTMVIISFKHCKTNMKSQSTKLEKKLLSAFRLGLCELVGGHFHQRVVGSFLYYGGAVDNTILAAINEISAAQASPTVTTLQKIQMLLNYLATYPNAKVRFYASDMQLHIDSDAAYLVAPKAKIRVAGFFYCSKKDDSRHIPPTLNGPVHNECRVLRHVVTSAAEAETTALFYNTQMALELVHILCALGQPQRPIPIKTDNATAASFVRDTLKQ